MAFQRVPNTGVFSTVVDLGASEYINSWYVRDTAAVRNAAYFGSMATAIGNAFRDNWMLSSVTEDYVFDRVQWRDLNTEFGLSGVTEYNTAGFQTDEPAPPQVALLVKLSGDAGGAPRQGRLYMFGARETVLDGATSLWTQAIVDSCVAAVNSVKTAISAAVPTSAMVIVSRYLNKNLRAEAVTNTLQAVSGRRLTASQRDRRPGIGS